MSLIFWFMEVNVGGGLFSIPSKYNDLHGLYYCGKGVSIAATILGIFFGSSSLLLLSNSDGINFPLHLSPIDMQMLLYVISISSFCFSSISSVGFSATVFGGVGVKLSYTTMHLALG